MLIVGDNENDNNHKIINSLLKEEIYTNDLLSNVMCVLKPKVFIREVKLTFINSFFVFANFQDKRNFYFQVDQSI